MANPAPPHHELATVDKERLIRELSKRIKVIKCPMCQESKFSVMDGFFSHFVQTSLGGVQIGGLSIPTAAIICGNCGFVSEHALGVLGMLPPGAK